jgi:phenol 2-monooxygenase (NADPH)
VKALPADGRWRIVVFAGDICYAERLAKLADFLSSMVRTFTPAPEDINSFIESIVVLSGERIKIEQEQLPNYFWPVSDKWGMRDLHKVYFDDESYNSDYGRAYEFYGIDPKHGCVAIMRPDQ